MSKLTPQEFQEKHARRLKGAIQDIQAGVQRVSTAPTAQAAKKADKMLANVSKAVQSGKWASRLNKVTLQDWQQATVNKGTPRIAAGIDGAAAKVVDFATQLLPYQDALASKVNALPDLTLEDSINRATTWIRGMAQFTKK